MDPYTFYATQFDLLGFPIPAETKKKSLNEVQNLNEIRRHLAREGKTQKCNLQTEFFDHGDVEISPFIKPKNNRKLTRKFLRENYYLFNLCNPNLYFQDLRLDKIPRKRIINAEKQLINVIVKPKISENPTRELYKKLSEARQAVQSSVSIPESSTQKEVRCWFKKRQNLKERKVYDIKTTESDILTDNLFRKHGDKSIERLLNCKRLLETLNMGPKKIASRKKSPSAGLNNGDCACPTYRNDPYRNPVDGQSHVTIFGNLGETNRNYVLQCAATVNDKPIEVNRVMCNTLKCANNKPSNAKTRRDSTAQTQFCCSNMECILRFQNESLEKRFTTQATQVDRNFSNHKNTLQNNLEVGTTHRSNSPTADIYKCEKQEIPLKDCQSPLVIISVYPRQITSNNSVKNAKFRENPPQIRKTKRSQSPKVQNTEHAQNLVEKKGTIMKYKNQMTRGCTETDKMVRNRTPSPPKKTTEKCATQKRDFANRTIAHTSKSISSSQKNKKDKNIDDFLNLKSDDKTNAITQGVQNNRKVNKNVKEVKKALIDNFLKNVEINDKYCNYSVCVPKDNASKITININNAKDHYDVVLEKNKFSNSDFKDKTKSYQERKPIKTDKTYANDIKNYLMLSKDQGYNQTKKNYVQPKEKKESNAVLRPRDSLDLSSRYEKQQHKVNVNRENRNENHLGPEARAVMKHFRGDACSVSDPNERDREIRELLGVFQNKKAYRNKTKNDEYKYMEIGKLNPKCSKNVMTGSSLIQLIQSIGAKNSPNEIRLEQLLKPVFKFARKGKIKNSKVKAKREIAAICKDILGTKAEKSNEKVNNPLPCESSAQRHLSQNLILNRNIQVFLQVEQYSRQKPIKLTKTQYDKLKKAIRSTISKKNCEQATTSCCIRTCSMVSVGEIKVKPKSRPPVHQNVDTQTSIFHGSDNTKLHRNNKGNNNDTSINMNLKREDRKKSVNKLLDMVIKGETVINNDSKQIEDYFSTPSICISNMANTNYDLSASSNHGKPVDSQKLSHVQEQSKSLHILFKGHKRSVTPNLGTSRVSLCSNVSDVNSLFKPMGNTEVKQKKPLLRRLISCLAMRPNPLSHFNGDALQMIPKVENFNSSIDSYHFSTSLGPLEMSSALYDTTASFYSNHTILPINKVKRGFFSSVRGFLTNRR